MGKKDFVIPWATLAIVALQIAFYSWQRGAADVGLIGYVHADFDFNWMEFTADPLRQLPTLISHTFMHANAEHLISNVIFFLLFGPSAEKLFGSGFFFGLYFLWGAVAALMGGYFSPLTAAIGASGAISGAAGAFFVKWPFQAPMVNLKKIPAFLLVGVWFLLNLKKGWLSFTDIPEIGYWAHVGGFAAGSLSAMVLPRRN